ISLNGKIERVAVVGNTICETAMAAIHIQDLPRGSGHILIANNSLFGSQQQLFRVWDYAPFKEYQDGQVELLGNLPFGGTATDFALILDPNQPGKDIHSGDAASLVRLWKFANNWRDMQGDDFKLAIPLAPLDKKLEDLPVISQDPKSKE